MLAWIGALFGGLNSLTGIGEKIADAYKAKQAALTDAERIAAEERIKTLELQRDVLVAEANSGGLSSWIRPLWAMPFMIWTWVVVVVDPIGCKWLFGHTCATDPLSEDMARMMAVVAGAYFIGRTAEKITRIVRR